MQVVYYAYKSDGTPYTDDDVVCEITRISDDKFYNPNTATFTEDYPGPIPMTNDGTGKCTFNATGLVAGEVYQLLGDSESQIPIMVTQVFVGMPDLQTSGRRTLAELRTRIRSDIFDTDPAHYVFTDEMINGVISWGITAYSEFCSLEKSTDIRLSAGDTYFTLPDDFMGMAPNGSSLSVTRIFGGKAYIEPVQTNTTAAFEYYAFHSIPTQDSECSSVPARDEELIKLYAKGRLFEMLAGDGAKHYEYTEGDVRENKGKTQAQFRSEANELLKDFQAGCLRSAELTRDSKPVTTTHFFGGVVSRRKCDGHHWGGIVR